MIIYYVEQNFDTIFKIHSQMNLKFPIFLKFHDF